MLNKWLFKLLTKDEDGVRQKLMRMEYVGLKAIFQLHWKRWDSHFWADREEKFFRYGSFIIEDELENCFWEDFWLGTIHLPE